MNSIRKISSELAGPVLLTLMAAPSIAQGPADRSADEAEIRRVISEFIETRDNADADALRALLTEDVDQAVTSGNVRKGRDAVVEGSLATTRATGGTRRITIETIRFIGDDVAIADGPYDILGRRDGDRHFRTTMVMKKAGGKWRIAAIRNMQPTGG